MGHIYNIAEPEKLMSNLGKGLIKTSRFSDYYLLIQNGSEIRQIKTAVSVGDFDRSRFLHYVDGILLDSGLFLDNANYRERSWDGFFPHKLTGIFYQEIKR